MDSSGPPSWIAAARRVARCRGRSELEHRSLKSNKSTFSLSSLCPLSCAVLLSDSHFPCHGGGVDIVDDAMGDVGNGTHVEGLIS